MRLTLDFRALNSSLAANHKRTETTIDSEDDTTFFSLNSENLSDNDELPTLKVNRFSKANNVLHNKSRSEDSNNYNDVEIQDPIESKNIESTRADKDPRDESEDKMANPVQYKIKHRVFSTQLVIDEQTESTDMADVETSFCRKSRQNLEAKIDKSIKHGRVNRSSRYTDLKTQKPTESSNTEFARADKNSRDNTEVKIAKPTNIDAKRSCMSLADELYESIELDRMEATAVCRELRDDTVSDMTELSTSNESLDYADVMKKPTEAETKRYREIMKDELNEPTEAKCMAATGVARKKLHGDTAIEMTEPNKFKQSRDHAAIEMTEPNKSKQSRDHADTVLKKRNKFEIQMKKLIKSKRMITFTDQRVWMGKEFDQAELDEDDDKGMGITAAGFLKSRIDAERKMEKPNESQRTKNVALQRFSKEKAPELEGLTECKEMEGAREHKKSREHSEVQSRKGVQNKIRKSRMADAEGMADTGTGISTKSHKDIETDIAEPAKSKAKKSQKNIKAEVKKPTKSTRTTGFRFRSRKGKEIDLDELNEYEVVAVTAADVEDYQDEDTEDVIEKLIETNLRKCSGRPRSIADIRADMLMNSNKDTKIEIEKPSKSAHMPNSYSFQRFALEGEEINEDELDEDEGITAADFLKSRIDAERKGVEKPTKSRRMPNPYRLPRFLPKGEDIEQDELDDDNGIAAAYFLKFRIDSKKEVEKPTKPKRMALSTFKSRKGKKIYLDELGEYEGMAVTAADFMTMPRDNNLANEFTSPPTRSKRLTYIDQTAPMGKESDRDEQDGMAVTLADFLKMSPDDIESRMKEPAKSRIMTAFRLGSLKWRKNEKNKKTKMEEPDKSKVGVPRGDTEIEAEELANSSRVGLRGGALESEGTPGKRFKESRRAKAQKAETEKEVVMVDVEMSDGFTLTISAEMLINTHRSKRQIKKDIKEFGPLDTQKEMIRVNGGEPFLITKGQACNLRREACRLWRLHNRQQRLDEEAEERAAEKAEKERTREEKQLVRKMKMKMTKLEDGRVIMEPMGPDDAGEGIDVLLPERANAMKAIWRNLAHNLKDLAPSYSNC